MNNGILVQDYSALGFENNLIKDSLGSPTNGINSPVSLPFGSQPYVYNSNTDYTKLVLVYDLSKSSGTSITVNFQNTGRFTVDWGNGDFSIVNITTPGSIQYAYRAYGTYTVQIFSPTYGQLLSMAHPKLIKILSFGNMNTTNIFNAFSGATNLIEVPKSIPSTLTSISYLFNNCTRLNDPNISLWVMPTGVTSLSNMFNGCSSFNQPLNLWNVSNITNMTSLFSSALSFNQDLNNWNVRKVTDFSSMFFNTINFNGSLSGWVLGADTTATICNTMFFGASNFTGAGLSSWDVSKVTSTTSMFRTSRFNDDISGWNMSNVITASAMFRENSSFNQNLNNWNVRKVTSFSEMFQSATSFNGSLSGWALGVDTLGTSCAGMFNSATAFVGSGLDTWDVSKVTNMSAMFRLTAFNQNISSWNVSNVTDMNLMFGNATVFNQPVGSWNVSKVTNMNQMFNAATAFDQDLSSWNLAGLNTNTALDFFLGNKPYSTANYNALLIGWNNNKLVGANGVANWRTDLRPNFGSAKYTSGGAAATARAALVSYGWTITDGGIA